MPYVKTWMTDVCGDQLREETKEYLLNLFAKTVENGLRFVSKKCVQAIAQVLLAKLLYHTTKLYNKIQQNSATVVLPFKDLESGTVCLLNCEILSSLWTRSGI